LCTELHADHPRWESRAAATVTELASSDVPGSGAIVISDS
jgi:hypothetical protein